jgi:sugar/nucleoside kinase (ribokinase family)
MTEKDIERISSQLEHPHGGIFLGIDGFVDEVWEIVETRTSHWDFEVFKEMKRFAQMIFRCGTGGFSHEIIRKRRSYGGFTANTGQSVGRLGGNPILVGLFGREKLDDAFQTLAGNYEVISVGNPALSSIYEFNDGKIILPYIEEVMDFNWERLTKAVPSEKLKTILSQSDIIALGYWSLTPAFDEIVSNICALIEPGSNKRMFFDFADLRKKDAESLRKTLELLAALNNKIPMTLSLNEHEAELLFGHYQRDFSDKTIEYVRKKTGLDELVVHTPHFSAGASAAEGVAVVKQDCCEYPVITTGAGDNFNGGYLIARLAGLGLAERLAVANAATHAYVRKGYSPDRAELVREMRKYIPKI